MLEEGWSRFVGVAVGEDGWLERVMASYCPMAYANELFLFHPRRRRLCLYCSTLLRHPL